jgi:hypothetical protein
MNIRHAPISSARSMGGGPGEYFFRPTNHKGEPRDPKPEKLFGDSGWFDHLARCSRSPHSHMHAILGYKKERRRLTRKEKDKILRMYLNVVRGGLDPSKVYLLGVDHGDHDHVAVYRHLVARDWPRFQPYFFERDRDVFSDFQWLINLKFELNAPENPLNAQIVSLAGKKNGEDEIDFVTELRAELDELRFDGKLQDHDAFLQHLKGKDCTWWLATASDSETGVVWTPGNETKSDRVVMKVSAPDGLEIQLKGPICSPGFTMEYYKANDVKKRDKYTAFLNNPSFAWQRFLNNYRKRCREMRELHPEFCESPEQDPLFEFADLQPNNLTSSIDIS